jgi:hypothetical protein
LIFPLLVVIVIAAVIFYAIHRKGRVKANFKFLGTAFSLEVEDKQSSPCLEPIPHHGRVLSRNARNMQRLPPTNTK